MKYADEFSPGDKVLFHGLKAKVREFPIREDWKLWAVPVSVQGSGFVTIAHAEALVIRGKP